MPEYEENMGRRNYREPMGLCWIDKYQDPQDVDLDIILVVMQIQDQWLRPHDRHWLICWLIGPREGKQQAYRVMQLNQEFGADHYTNWGPKTRMNLTFHNEPETVRQIKLGTFSYEKRKIWEDIGRNLRVQVPDGTYNCQSWITQLLDQAVERGLISGETRAQVLDEARRE